MFLFWFWFVVSWLMNTFFLNIVLLNVVLKSVCMLCEAPWFDIEQYLHTGVPYIYFPPLVAIEKYFIFWFIVSRLMNAFFKILFFFWILLNCTLIGIIAAALLLGSWFCLFLVTKHLPPLNTLQRPWRAVLSQPWPARSPSFGKRCTASQTCPKLRMITAKGSR